MGFLALVYAAIVAVMGGVLGGFMAMCLTCLIIGRAGDIYPDEYERALFVAANCGIALGVAVSMTVLLLSTV